jgi:hypothetical protein
MEINIWYIYIIYTMGVILPWNTTNIENYNQPQWELEYDGEMMGIFEGIQLTNNFIIAWSCVLPCFQGN